MKKYIFAIMALFMVSLTTFAQADKILGVYKFKHGKITSKVRFTKSGNGYTGQVIWVDHPTLDKDGNVRLDTKNPDPKKRNVPTNQVVIIDKVTYSDGTWSGGHIYDPTDGKLYNVKFSFTDDKTLKVRGYIGSPLLGQTMTWTKVE